MITQRFRRDYLGEFVISGTNIRDGVKIQQREWIPNVIENHHLSNRAAALLSDMDRPVFDYARLQFHKGGLRGSKRLQTYGTGVTWQHLVLNFYISTDDAVLEEITKNSYTDQTVVYTDRRRVLKYPNQLYLIPHCPFFSDPAMPLYLAAFDGHTEIFVIGVLGHVSGNDRLIENIADTMKVYDCCQFIFVNAESALPVAWRGLSNFRSMDAREFVSYCDV